MKNILTAIIILIVLYPNPICADLLGNPGVQVGKKNLFVGIEYSSIMHEYELDTNGIETTSERISLKVTTGLSDWFDIFIKAGGASLMLDYKKERNAIKNFDSDFSAGFGLGGRLRLLNFVDSETRVFIQGGGYLFKSEDNFRYKEWRDNQTKTINTDREIKWADMYFGFGIAKRMDFIDLNFGVGFSQIKWWINDVEYDGNRETTLDQRDSFDSLNPIYGFIGLDFILPYEYRISAQVGIRNMDEAEFSVALSQGREKD